MKKILILGDDLTWQWHPLGSLQPLLEMLSRENFSYNICTKYDSLTDADLASYSIILNYVDNWTNRGSHESELALLSWLEKGGHLISIHNGIIIPEAKELQKLHGAAFSHHDPFRTLNFSLTETGKKLFPQIEAFQLDEEPYEFTFYPNVEKEIFLEYTRDGEPKTYPAGWHTRAGEGEIWYFCPGHTPVSMANPQLLTMILDVLNHITE